MDEKNLDFKHIFETYRPRVVRYLNRLVGEAEAEDLAQEVFLKVNRGIKDFRGDSQLSTWLYRIATNTAIDKIRSASFRQESELSGLEDSDQAVDSDLWTGEEALSLEQQLMHTEMYECFLDFVKRLPPGYRSIIVLSELEDLPNREIAEILGLSLEVVKIRLHRGRARLFQELKAHCRAEDWL